MTRNSMPVTHRKRSELKPEEKAVFDMEAKNAANRFAEQFRGYHSEFLAEVASNLSKVAIKRLQGEGQ